MSLNLTQAKQRLAEIMKGAYSTNDLLSLVNDVDISAEGSVTVLYSGTVNNVSSSTMAEQMTADPNVRVIDKTEAAKLLKSDDFLVALGKTRGIEPQDMLSAV